MCERKHDGIDQSLEVNQQTFIDPTECDFFQLTLLVIRCPSFSNLSGIELEDLIQKMKKRAELIKDDQAVQS
jgi:hypothetical protein